MSLPTESTIHEEVRQRYAASARQVMASGDAACCGEQGIGAELYSALERQELPDAAVLASLGCGNPTAVAELREGERVLDLGSGGGIDVLLSAKRVGPSGRAIGLDMTDEMLALAQRNAAEAGATNVEFLKGHIEAIPLPADSIDVVISNCVDQPGRRQAGGVPRDRAGAEARWADGGQRHRGGGLPDAGRAGGARVVRRLHRRRAVVQRVRGGPDGRRPGATSRSRRPTRSRTACTAPSSRPPSRWLPRHRSTCRRPASCRWPPPDAAAGAAVADFAT